MAAGRREEKTEGTPNLVAVRKSVRSAANVLSANPWFVAGSGRAVGSGQWAVASGHWAQTKLTLILDVGPL
ncbi:hypothetical protein E4U31_003654 [Claviceps sp. LM219 group G6]|nr:hypothetical protein E4U31_003654 [Claviceps sp. LM219 group G6]